MSLVNFLFFIIGTLVGRLVVLPMKAVLSVVESAAFFLKQFLQAAVRVARIQIGGDE